MLFLSTTPHHTAPPHHSTPHHTTPLHTTPHRNKDDLRASSPCRWGVCQSPVARSVGFALRLSLSTSPLQQFHMYRYIYAIVTFMGHNINRGDTRGKIVGFTFGQRTQKERKGNALSKNVYDTLHPSPSPQTMYTTHTPSLSSPQRMNECTTHPIPPLLFKQ